MSSSDDSDGIAECYTVNADVKNNIILDVSTENENLNENTEEKEDKVKADTLKKVPKVQEKFNQMALEAIRQSLTSKISVQEELSDKNEDEVDKIISKSNFEANREKVSNALGFTRKPSTKSKKAPEPPSNSGSFNQLRNAIEEAKSGIKSPEKVSGTTEIEVVSSVQSDGTPKNVPSTPKNVPETPKVDVTPKVFSTSENIPNAPKLPGTPLITTGTPLNPTGTPENVPKNVPKSNGATVLQNDTTTVVQNNSKIPEAPPLPNTGNSTGTATEIKPIIKNQESSQSSVVKSVQFSPDTQSITLEPEIQTISYNRWINGSGNKVIESSFTGQPIAVQTPVRPQSMHNKKVPVVTGQNGTETDEIRKWTEKKKGLRSKSLPRGSEIDEILGSSKTKPQTRLFPVVLTPAPKPVHRQSRVELYENDRKRMRQSTKFSSIKKLFKLGSNPNLSELNQRRNSISSPMDKEHEREILERERSKLRPEIIHPLDLQSGGVEVVKITPKSSQNSTKKSILANLKKEDSGHETSSIHSDSNEASTSSNSSEVGGQVRPRSTYFLHFSQ